MLKNIRELKRKLKNAKQRVAYWSGRPSFTAKSFRPGIMGRTKDGRDIEDERAVFDCESLEQELSRRIRGGEKGA